MSTQTLAKLFGAVFLVIGILGFVPGITSDGYLLGIFEVDTLHNIIHLLSGILALVLAKDAMKAKLYFKVFGVVYALVTIIGFLHGSSVLGLIGVNLADNLLHLIIAVAALIIGFGGSHHIDTPVQQQAPQQPMNNM